MIDDIKKELLKKLYLLNREETEYLSKASIAEAIKVLIEACEFSVGNYNEKSDEK